MSTDAEVKQAEPVAEKPEHKLTRADAIMENAAIQKYHREAAARILGVDDIEHVSRGNLYRAIIILNNACLSAVNRYRTELFCADPHHKEFRGVSEAELAPYRLERIRRMSGDREPAAEGGSKNG